MTEAEWDVCTDPQLMLEFLQGKASDRKLRLFAVACCRSVWNLLTEASRKAVDVAESYAEEIATDEELDLACDQASVACGGVANSWDAAQDIGSSYFAGAFDSAADAGAYAAVWASIGDDRLDVSFVANAVTFGSRDSTRKGVTFLLQDILGPLPFRPVSIDPAWNNGTVRHLAQAIYDERAFDRMPILADALEEAGCTNQDIIEHCRGSGPHVRGCWVVDLLLGKE